MDNAIAPSEARRQEIQRRIEVDQLLRAAKRRDRSPLKQIEIGFVRPHEAQAGLAAFIARHVAAVAEPERESFARAFGRLLTSALQRRSVLLGEERFINALAALAGAWPQWLSEPEQWRPRTHNAGRQCVSLARHLLARYELPAWMDAVWLDDSSAAREGRGWYAHLGRGENLRTAADLPFPLTKAMAHQAMRADTDLTPRQALRWGQFVALGACPRVARAAALSRLGRPCRAPRFFGSRQPRSFFNSSSQLALPNAPAFPNATSQSCFLDGLLRAVRPLHPVRRAAGGAVTVTCRDSATCFCPALLQGHSGRCSSQEALSASGAPHEQNNDVTFQLSIPCPSRSRKPKATRAIRPGSK